MHYIGQFQSVVGKEGRRKVGGGGRGGGREGGRGGGRGGGVAVGGGVEAGEAGESVAASAESCPYICIRSCDAPATGSRDRRRCSTGRRLHRNREYDSNHESLMSVGVSYCFVFVCEDVYVG